VFAILGLRSIYFALAHLLQIFRYLKYAISLILIFVGAKIALANLYPVPVGVALGVILFLLAGAVALSVLIKAPDGPGPSDHPGPPVTPQPPGA
jgi:tellurite resistance protein TerC